MTTREALEALHTLHRQRRDAARLVSESGGSLDLVVRGQATIERVDGERKAAEANFRQLAQDEGVPEWLIEHLVWGAK